ncbi:hypothetical protein CLM85_07925 [Streptomyces albidoflavus]|uniref:hypothetical protein n=1 Tax=Streptomyces albidoflavus TaxID=1886 RepID=UPI000BADE4D6|nr:hypothetical protein [Streptomyces albidoflavus]PAX84802.1 hypothetical protein CLM81_15365 [Streptomyces albidoflavus]PAX89660.1 hypothetical protein CLM82_19965 [Streptomyces albidoflavus]PBO15129.1 hypothetical protein CLM83_32175 [Streptomyces albidoflavus]PBO24790.1 hypothetical protein CLM85_07925 [Streptomyces albidoflavus]PBO31218.1 hypothetical protein CLM84_03765 [Streptomyces albidoflavus]
MLALRLTRGAHPFVLCGRLLVAAASAGTGFLMLSALSHALAHPGAGGALLRLAWCVVPLTATVYFAVAMARNDPATRPREGLSSVGLGPAALAGLAAASTALSSLLGSVVALLFFLHLRGDLTGLPFDGAAAGMLAADQPLPLPAVLTLLAIVPAVASLATAVVLRPRAGRPAPTAPRTEPATPLPVPSGLPWGVALLATGLAVESWAARGTSRDGGVPLPGGVESGALGGVLGWLLTALGLALAGPGLTHFCGRVLQAAKPGAVRLLAGRGLQEEATRIGRPVGVVCAVASGALASATLYGAGTGASPAGPLTALGAVLVAGCALATLLSAGVEARRSRASANAALLRLGAPASALRNAATLRALTLLVVFVPLTWAVATLAAAPLRG